MQLDAIISTILSAAAFLKKPVQDAAGDSIKDLLDAARYYLKKNSAKALTGPTWSISRWKSPTPRCAKDS